MASLALALPVPLPLTLTLAKLELYLDHGGEVVGVVLGRGLEELVRHGDAYLVRVRG